MASAAAPSSGSAREARASVGRLVKGILAGRCCPRTLAGHAFARVRPRLEVGEWWVPIVLTRVMPIAVEGDADRCWVGQESPHSRHLRWVPGQCYPRPLTGALQGR